MYDISLSKKYLPRVDPVGVPYTVLKSSVTNKITEPHHSILSR